MRKSGVLVSVPSLPRKYGIGCFDEAAYKFVDDLVEAKQTYWQILPLGITGYGDSPYQSFSTFAGNPYFISLDEFVKCGYKFNTWYNMIWMEKFINDHPDHPETVIPFLELPDDVFCELGIAR